MPNTNWRDVVSLLDINTNAGFVVIIGLDSLVSSAAAIIKQLTTGYGTAFAPRIIDRVVFSDPLPLFHPVLLCLWRNAWKWGGREGGRILSFVER